MVKKSYSRSEYEASRTGSLMTYVAQKGDAFAKRVDLLSRLIHGNHEPSLGGYKERLLSDAIRQSIPRRYEIGTGFVAFPKLKNGDGTSASHEISKQLDVIIYDSTEYAPIFRDGDFVIVPPRAVRAIVEVKSSASYSSVRDVVEWAIDFGNKWDRCCGTYTEMAFKPPRPPALIAMFWDVYVTPSGTQEITPKNLSMRICDTYNELVKPPIKKTFPVIDIATIYSKVLVRPTIYIKDEKSWVGWWTYRGQFVKKSKDEYCEVGDRTIADIVACIFVRADLKM